MERMNRRTELGRSWMTSLCPELLCPICKELFECPQTFYASCGHTFCLRCANMLFEDQSQAICPECNQAVCRSDMKGNPPLAALIKRLTSSTQSEQTPSPRAQVETVMSTPGTAQDNVNTARVQNDQIVLSHNDKIIKSQSRDANFMVSEQRQIMNDDDPQSFSPARVNFDDAWTEKYAASCGPLDLDSCKAISSEVEKIERLAGLARFLLNGGSVLIPVVPSNSNNPSTHAAHESPVNAHRTAEIDAALEAFGLDIGKSMPPLFDNHDSQNLLSKSGIVCTQVEPTTVEGDHAEIVEKKKKPGPKRGRKHRTGAKTKGKVSTLKSKDASSTGKDHFGELDPLAAAHTSWTQDDNDIQSRRAPLVGRGRGRKPGSGPRASTKSSGDQKLKGTRTQSPIKRLRVKDKTHVHPTVAQTIDMGVPPPEPKKPTKGRRGGHARRESRKRKSSEEPQIPPGPRIRSKRHEIIAENGGVPVAIDDIFDMKLDTIDEAQFLTQDMLMPPPPLPARRHRRLQSKKVAGDDSQALEVPLRLQTPDEEQEEPPKPTRKSDQVESKEDGEQKPIQKKRGRKPLANGAKKGKRGPKGKGTKRASSSTVTSYGLKRQRCQAMVGTSVEIYWDGMDSWYKGQILHYRARNRDFEVAYEDGEIHWEPLLARQEGSRWRMCTQDADEPIDDSVPQEQETTQPSASGAFLEPEQEPPSTTKVICASDLEISRLTALKDFCEEIGGGYYVSKIDRNTTHLILGTVEDNHAIKRTEKLMKAVLYEAKIVSAEWLDKSFEAKAWVDETPYLVQGDTRSRVNWAETKYNGQMFEGLQFEVENSEGVLFSALREVINAGGGKYTLTPNALATDDGESYILLLTGDTENGHNNDAVDEDDTKIRIRHEWVFDSVSALELLPWDEYEV